MGQCGAYRHTAYTGTFPISLMYFTFAVHRDTAGMAGMDGMNPHYLQKNATLEWLALSPRRHLDRPGTLKCRFDRATITQNLPQTPLGQTDSNYIIAKFKEAQRRAGNG